MMTKAESASRRPMTGQWFNHLIVHERIDKWREGDDPQTTTDDQALYAYVENGELIHTIFIEWDEEDSEWIIEGESVEKIIIARTSSGVPISWSDRTVDYAPGIWSALATAMSRSQEYQLRLAHRVNQVNHTTVSEAGTPSVTSSQE